MRLHGDAVCGRQHREVQRRHDVGGASRRSLRRHLQPVDIGPDMVAWWMVHDDSQKPCGQCGQHSSCVSIAIAILRAYSVSVDFSGRGLPKKSQILATYPQYWINPTNTSNHGFIQCKPSTPSTEKCRPAAVRQPHDHQNWRPGRLSGVALAIAGQAPGTAGVNHPYIGPSTRNRRPACQRFHLDQAPAEGRGSQSCFRKRSRNGTSVLSAT